jgi:hypothetical protein
VAALAGQVLGLLYGQQFKQGVKSVLRRFHDRAVANVTLLAELKMNVRGPRLRQVLQGVRAAAVG